MCRRTVSLGAYLLGALDPTERSQFEDHIASCAHCKSELVRLAPLPGLLQRLSPADYQAIETEGDLPDWPIELPAEIALAGPMPDMSELPDPSNLSNLSEPPPARPGWLRRSRAAIVAAAAVVLLAGGGFVVMHDDTPAPAIQASPVAWTAVDPTTGVFGRVELTKRGWGTELRLSMEAVPEGRKLCHMIVYGRDGSSEIAGQWAAGNYTAIRSAPGSTSIQLSDIERVEVVAGGALLVGIHAS
ncbi:anti-sigma factor family protein [Actinocrispum wychmicini]|uniref:Putative zinc finger protein n=1 Tax=Actinocrispum wychmicini TaxID=1213861 RepID=A0A4R2JBW3_9PSEU|nr:zf-HC2 domain-containing protein [Actinocrispum wychmicini]TCO56993.1 putative zinc finger protein [Actinocrispum wychmicini]